jgi:hypothetical protein
MLRKILLFIDTTLLCLAIFIGIDYSYYVANVKYVNNTTTVILSDLINLDIENKDIVIENKKVNETEEIKFKVENLVDKDATFNIYFSNITNDYEKNLTYELYEQDKLVVSSTIAPQNNSNSYIKLNINLSGAETKEYTLKFTLLNRGNQEETYFENKKFSATLNINSLTINDEIKTATNYLLANNEIVEDINMDGLHKTDDTNSKESSYYFKGNVSNNYVSLNNELWRIIKINEDGSIKIIKDTNIESTYQYSLDSKQENSYNYLNSNIKNELDNYYENNLKDYHNLIQEENYCTELSVVKNDNYKVDDANKTYLEYTPSFKCNTENSLSIGLISYDEAILAGLSYTGSYNNTNYLVNGSSKSTFTISPAGVNGYTNENYVWKITDNGAVIETSVSNTLYIRPVINLKASLNITGDGTINNPFIFSE